MWEYEDLQEYKQKPSRDLLITVFEYTSTMLIYPNDQLRKKDIILKAVNIRLSQWEITVTFKPKEWAPLLQWGTEDVISNIKRFTKLRSSKIVRTVRVSRKQ